MLTDVFLRQRHKQGAVFGSAKKIEKVEDTPGPGNYKPNIQTVQTRSYEALIIGAQPHSYIQKGSAELPGPGSYIEIEDPRLSKSQRGSRAGGFSQSKRKTEF